MLYGIFNNEGVLIRFGYCSPEDLEKQKGHLVKEIPFKPEINKTYTLKDFAETN